MIQRPVQGKHARAEEQDNKAQPAEPRLPNEFGCMQNLCGSDYGVTEDCPNGIHQQVEHRGQQKCGRCIEDFS